MSKEDTTKKCKYCKMDIPAQAKICPHCRKKQKGMGCLGIILLLVFTLLIIVSLVTSLRHKKGINTASMYSNVSAKDRATVESETPADIPLDSVASSETSAESETLANVYTEAETETDTSTAETESAVPAEYKTALIKAKTYSEIMSMSKNGIYRQLTSQVEGFSPEAAQYAVDNMQADWNANALKKAETYSDTMNMSKKGIYRQLTSEFGEQFTEEEAQYAIDNMQADWNANALKKAKFYQNTMSMSPKAIYQQLSSDAGEQFSPEEAQYAVDNLNK